MSHLSAISAVYCQWRFTVGLFPGHYQADGRTPVGIAMLKDANPFATILANQA